MIPTGTLLHEGGSSSILTDNRKCSRDASFFWHSHFIAYCVQTGWENQTKEGWPTIRPDPRFSLQPVQISAKACWRQSKQKDSFVRATIRPWVVLNNPIDPAAISRHQPWLVKDMDNLAQSSPTRWTRSAKRGSPRTGSKKGCTLRNCRMLDCSW